MKKNKPIKIISLVFLLLLFTNCETIIDCISRIEPRLISKELSAGTIYKNYNDNVSFEMVRANTSDYYISDISVEGNLPPNVNYKILSNGIIKFSGIPQAIGIYEFTISITVSPNVYNSDSTDGLCGDTASNKYRIIIN